MRAGSVLVDEHFAHDKDISTTALVLPAEFPHGTESASIPVAVAAQPSTAFTPQRNLEQMATPDVFGRACPQCRSTSTICTAGTFNHEVWLCNTCLRRFEVALHDDPRPIDGVSAAPGERQTSPNRPDVQCPQCGHGGGLCLAPKEERTAASPVRCFSCGGESAISRWQREPGNRSSQEIDVDKTRSG